MYTNGSVFYPATYSSASAQLLGEVQVLGGACDCCTHMHMHHLVNASDG